MLQNEGCKPNESTIGKSCDSANEGVSAGGYTSEPSEILTEDLLERLLKCENVQQYLDEGGTIDRTLADYLKQLLKEKGLKRADVVRASGLNQTFVYDIFAAKTRPGRDNAIMLAFGLQCSLKEAQRLLRLAGVSELWPKVRRDAIIIWCIQNGYNRAACDDELWQFEEQTLLGTGVLK